MLKWTNAAVQKCKPCVRPIGSFKDLAIIPEFFFLDLLMRRDRDRGPRVINVTESGAFQDQRQSDNFFLCVGCIRR
ncbi:uncharacterized protein EDB91DRAFT_1163678 [Suillus paluster]|uniref:uncharacterized protein n=1 Tax=Suillus paluster TaxID=48578 RepID=UPI001B86A9FC|nr:uncharacterized protein EDB91DRAFT_1163678 [Suillus paluster]KAG1727562.1 hypothetical protein EDB91DRAFT_1163678 [Suillus paluster]